MKILSKRFNKEYEIPTVNKNGEEIFTHKSFEVLFQHLQEESRLMITPQGTPDSWKCGDSVVVMLKISDNSGYCDFSIGESTAMSLDTEISKMYPVCIAYNRAFDRAVRKYADIQVQLESDTVVEELDNGQGWPVITFPIVPEESVNCESESVTPVVHDVEPVSERDLPLSCLEQPIPKIEPVVAAAPVLASAPTLTAPIVPPVYQPEPQMLQMPQQPIVIPTYYASENPGIEIPQAPVENIFVSQTPVTPVVSVSAPAIDFTAPVAPPAVAPVVPSIPPIVTPALTAPVAPTVSVMPEATNQIQAVVNNIPTAMPLNESEVGVGNPALTIIQFGVAQGRTIAETPDQVLQWYIDNIPVDSAFYQIVDDIKAYLTTKR